MPPRERALDRGARLARQDLTSLGNELRIGRVSRGLTLAQVGRSAGMSPSQVSRIERGLLPSASVIQVARLGGAVGLDVRIRAYPGPAVLRDEGQVALIRRFRALIHPRLRLRLEVPLPPEGDQRAWDVVIDGFSDRPGEGLPADADTRLYDFQGQYRRITLKARDAAAAHVTWVVADTRANRRAVGEARPLIADAFPVSARHALSALRAGRYPGGSSLLFV